jgi:two-component system sensor histidine kinase SenX3
VDLVVLAVTGFGGLAVGLAAGLAFRSSERSVAQPIAASPLPSGAASVLAVLQSQAVVLDRDNGVVKASPGVHAHGLVRDGRLAPVRLLELADATRRDGEIRQEDLEIARDRHGHATMHIQARVAPLGADLVLVLMQDRTEVYRLEAVRRDFVANVSHELKTPVGALSLLAEAVLEANDDPEAVKRFADRMQVESARLTALVRELLELSRVQSDDPLAAPEPVAVDDVVRAALDRSGALAASRRIRLQTTGERGLQVLGSERQLLMALGNLVVNAVTYSPDASRVVVGVRTAGEAVEISVVDQGIGIPPAEQERIFERFYRVDPARARATGGTGLGLAIVKHIAAVHGGEVSVWSVEGAGSTFTLRLPALPGPSPNRTSRHSRRQHEETNA